MSRMVWGWDVPINSHEAHYQQGTLEGCGWQAQQAPAPVPGTIVPGANATRSSTGTSGLTTATGLEAARIPMPVLWQGDGVLFGPSGAQNRDTMAGRGGGGSSSGRVELKNDSLVGSSRNNNQPSVADDRMFVNGVRVFRSKTDRHHNGGSTHDITASIVPGAQETGGSGTGGLKKEEYTHGQECPSTIVRGGAHANASRPLNALPSAGGGGDHSTASKTANMMISTTTTFDDALLAPHFAPPIAAVLFPDMDGITYSYRKPLLQQRPLKRCSASSEQRSDGYTTTVDEDKGCVVSTLSMPERDAIVMSVRTAFRDCVFYLNSCDTTGSSSSGATTVAGAGGGERELAVSAYILEKLIRFMGGSTVPGLSAKRVTYVLSQRLSYAKASALAISRGAYHQQKGVRQLPPPPPPLASGVGDETLLETSVGKATPMPSHIAAPSVSNNEDCGGDSDDAIFAERDGEAEEEEEEFIADSARAGQKRPRSGGDNNASRHTFDDDDCSNPKPPDPNAVDSEPIDDESHGGAIFFKFNNAAAIQHDNTGTRVSSSSSKGRAVTQRTLINQERYLHPHYVLACAWTGRRLPHQPFRTMVELPAPPPAAVVKKDLSSSSSSLSVFSSFFLPPSATTSNHRDSRRSTTNTGPTSAPPLTPRTAASLPPAAALLAAHGGVGGPLVFSSHDDITRYYSCAPTSRGRHGVTSAKVERRNDGDGVDDTAGHDVSIATGANSFEEGLLADLLWVSTNKNASIINTRNNRTNTTATTTGVTSAAADTHPSTRVKTAKNEGNTLTGKDRRVWNAAADVTATITVVVDEDDEGNNTGTEVIQLCSPPAVAAGVTAVSTSRSNRKGVRTHDGNLCKKEAVIVLSLNSTSSSSGCVAQDGGAGGGSAAAAEGRDGGCGDDDVNVLSSQRVPSSDDGDPPPSSSTHQSPRPDQRHRHSHEGAWGVVDSLQPSVIISGEPTKALSEEVSMGVVEGDQEVDQEDDEEEPILFI